MKKSADNGSFSYITNPVVIAHKGIGATASWSLSALSESASKSIPASSSSHRLTITVPKVAIILKKVEQTRRHSRKIIHSSPNLALTLKFLINIGLRDCGERWQLIGSYIKQAIKPKTMNKRTKFRMFGG